MIITSSRIAIALNARFVPASHRASHAVGASGFALNAADLLSTSGLLAGFLIYERDEDLSLPSLARMRVHDHPAVRLRFNFRMPPVMVQEAISVALRLLGRDEGTLVPYYQSNTLLPLHPREVPFLVTHHGPFAQEVSRSFGRRFAVDAFRGGAAKVDHLERMQACGVRVLRGARRGVALELSGVQESYLLRAGVAPEKVVRIAPPWELAPVDVEGESRDSSGAGAHDDDGDGDGLHLVTMVARADTFKNLPRLIEAANALTRDGVSLRLSIFAGADDDEHARAALSALVSPELRARTRIAPRLSHDALLAYFKRHRTGRIFVCTSLYETFGLTPLEAMISGMVTLLPDNPVRIGVVDYAPSRYLYAPSVQGLIEAVQRLHRLHRLALCGHLLPRLGEEQRAFARHLLLTRAFESTMCAAMARVMRRLPAQDTPGIEPRGVPRWQQAGA